MAFRRIGPVSSVSVDGETGETFERCMISVETLGADGQCHMTWAVVNPSLDAEIMKAMFLMLERGLEQNMKDKGIWP